MTEIRFFHNAEDKLEAACRITATAWRKGRRVTVLAEDANQARRFDHMLWSWQALSFIPHVAAHSPLAAETPVLITLDLANSAHQDVAINLGNGMPMGFENYAQLLEIVTMTPEDRNQARARWAQYKTAGYALESNDLAAREQA